MNNYRNKKVPREQTELPYHKYIPLYKPKSRENPEWENIIKPTLADEQYTEAV